MGEDVIPSSFYIDSDSLEKWRYFKGAKSERRIHSSGFEWHYKEGAMTFPDDLDSPSRTILTAEGVKRPQGLGT